jgi:DNA-binding PadR family transcriptional regulator
MEGLVEGRLGEFEQLVLLALLRLEDEAYGVAVQREIARRIGRSTSFGTVYTTLARLEDKHLIVSRLGEPTPERGGRRKKYFRLLPAGRRALDESLRALRNMARGLAASWQAP